MPNKEMSYLKMWALSFFEPALHLPFDTFVTEMKYNNKKVRKAINNTVMDYPTPDSAVLVVHALV